jgi:hypothetical protein
MIGELNMKRIWEEPTIAAFAWRDLGKPRRTSLKIVGVPGNKANPSPPEYKYGALPLD